MLCTGLRVTLTVCLVVSVSCQSSISASSPSTSDKSTGSTPKITTTNNPNITTTNNPNITTTISPNTTTTNNPNTTTTSNPNITTTNNPNSTTTTQNFTSTTQNITTTAAVSTTTAKPSGPPVYKLKNKVGKYCMLLQANMTVTFTMKSNQTVVASVPQLNAVGSCGNLSDVMNLTWPHTLPVTTTTTTTTTMTPSVAGTFVSITLSLRVTRKDKDSSYSLSSVLLTNSEDENSTLSISNLDLFKTSEDSYYLCKSENKTVTSKDKNLSLQIRNVKFTAFAAQDKPAFSGTANDCSTAPGGTTDTIVPIVVGCALAGMVLIVLVGYCIGRRRTRSGYQQMEA